MKSFYSLILLCLLLVSGIASSYGQLAGGTYTIGGTAPDYATFNAAVTAMNTGIAGPVTFHVRQGTYNEQVTLSAIVGASAVSQVIFRPDPANTLPVELTFSPTTSGSNFTLRFNNNAAYINFDNITITTTGSLYSRVISFNAADNITIDSCQIIGASATSTSTNYAVIYNFSGTTSQATNITFSNNHIDGGSYAVYWYGGTSTSPETGNTFINDSITGFYYRGLNAYYQQDFTARGNYIQNNGQYSSPAGYYGYYNNSAEIDHNKIYITGSTGPDGLYISTSDGTPAKPTRITNNFIVVNGGSSSSYGISNYSSNQIQFAHNSIRINGGSSTSAGYYLSASTGDTVVLRNNIFAADGVLAVYIASSTPVVDSDYNDLYTTGTDLAYNVGTYYSTLAAYQSATSRETNSLSVDPDFYSATNLHSFSLALDGAATPLAYVTDDIDGDLRSATPDIGADEYVVLAFDAGVLRIDTPNVVSCNAGQVYVTVRNFGTSTLTSVTVNWGVNSSANTPVTFSTLNLASGTDTTLFVGTTTYTNGDTVFAFTSNPNGSPENPSGSTNDYKSRVVVTGLQGTFTMGGPGADYYSYAAVINDLSLRGICGPVTILVNDSTYNEQVDINPILGTSMVNTVTFMSASGDSSQSILSFGPTASASNYVIRLSGADHIHFKNLTIENTGTTYGRAIDVLGNSDYNNFSNNIIKSSTTNTGTNTALIYSSSSGSSRGNTFMNNHIEGGYYGFYWYGNSASDRGKELTVEGNTIYNQYYYGTYFYYQDSMKFHNNTYWSGPNTNTTNYSFRGAYISNFEITSNDINDTLGGAGYGFYLTNSEGNIAKKAIIRNNMISRGNAASGSYQYGIYLTTSGNIEVSHNSVSLTSSYVSSAALYVSGGGQVEVLNNSFALLNTGYTVYYNTSYSIERSNYNNIYVASGGFFVVADGWGYPTLAVWQNNTQNDLNSISVNPNYNSLTDLHTCNSALDGKALTGYAMVDFDGEPRLTPPDIGADEFIGSNFSLGPDVEYCTGSNVTIGFPHYYGNSFVWSTGDTTSSITVSAPGTYSLIITGACGGNTDNIDVTENPGPMPSFTYTNSYLTVNFNNTTTNGTSYLWDFGDGSTSTDVNPMHLFTTSGLHNVTLHATNDCGTDSIMIMVNVQVPGVGENALSELVELYPNPSFGTFRIRMNGVESGSYNLRVSNLQGQTVHTEVIRSGNAIDQQVQVPSLAAGLYQVTLEGPSGVAVKQIVIQ